MTVLHHDFKKGHHHIFDSVASGMRVCRRISPSINFDFDFMHGQIRWAAKGLFYVLLKVWLYRVVVDFYMD